MVIEHSAQQDLHWNYFLALEEDVLKLSRYIEFAPKNMKTYSLEMARILLATASEVDVVAKLLVKLLDPASKADKIDGYRLVIKKGAPEISTSRVAMPRFGLNFTPWDNWQGDTNPDWWRDHNAVKHRRNEKFASANLTNVLNALAGLFVLLVIYGKQKGLKEYRPAPHIVVPDALLAMLDMSNEGSILQLRAIPSYSEPS